MEFGFLFWLFGLGIIIACMHVSRGVRCQVSGIRLNVARFFRAKGNVS